MSLDLRATFFLMQPKMLLAFLVARAYRWLMVYLESTRTPRCFSAEMLSSWSSPILYWCLELFLPGCRTLCFLLMNFMKFLLAYYSAFWHPSECQCNQLVYQPLLPVYVIIKLAEGALCPIIQVINEVVKRYWPQYWCLGYTSSDFPPSGLYADHNP